MVPRFKPVFTYDHQSYLCKGGNIQRIMEIDLSPIINNNPPHFLLRLSDVCISFGFLIGEV